jgi:hypothetical protein
MESKADPTILYLHPDGKYELKRYALARGPKVKVHDLLLEAVEDWAQRHRHCSRLCVCLQRGSAAPKSPSAKRSCDLSSLEQDARGHQWGSYDVDGG